MCQLRLLPILKSTRNFVQGYHGVQLLTGRKEEEESWRARESGGKEKNILLATSPLTLSSGQGKTWEVKMRAWALKYALSTFPRPHSLLSLSLFLSLSLPLTLSHSLSLCPPFLSVELCVRESCRRVKLLSVSLAHRCSLYVCSCDRCSLMVC